MLAIPDEARALVRRTPLLFAPELGVHLKLESLQRTGSFKLRGAACKLARLSSDERARGVVSASAGNHGQGLAFAAGRLGARVRIVVPSSVPRVKRDAISALGATLEVFGDRYEEAEARARAIAKGDGALFVSAFDDDDVILGNGSWLGEEIAEQLPDVAEVVAPVGGGGLLGGLARALAPRGVRLVGVQTDADCAMHDSLAGGRALTTYAGHAPTRCEGLEGPVAERTFAIVRDLAARVQLVPESSVLDGIALAYRSRGLLVEPSAAVVFAALAEGVIAPSPRTVLVVSGGNVDPDLVDEALAR